MLILVVASFVPESADLSTRASWPSHRSCSRCRMWVCGSFMPWASRAFCSPSSSAVVIGATDYKAVFSGFGVSVVFYIIAIFALPALLLKTQWGVRLMAEAAQAGPGESSRKLVLAFMIGTCLISTIMSDVPAAVLFMGISYVVLKAAGAEPGKSTPRQVHDDRHTHCSRHRRRGHAGRQLVQHGGHGRAHRRHRPDHQLPGLDDRGPAHRHPVHRRCAGSPS
ncbi:MAG: hypothetical protein V8S24_16175 [Gordonibacter pamelaeae]